MAREGLSVRAAALQLQEWFMLPGQKPNQPSSAKTETTKKPEATPQAAGVINPPLGFRLRVDPAHEYGQKRGVPKEVIEQFGAGLCLSKGMFAGRFVFPLHDEQGRVIGYAGRSVDETEPKYLFPSSEKGFQKRHLLFNLHREIKELDPDEPVIVVEGFFDCLRVKTLGYPCVALLGAALSKEQEQLLAAYFQRVILLLDGDKAGQSATEDCLNRLGRKVFVKALTLAEGQQPDMMSQEDVVLALLKGTQPQLLGDRGAGGTPPN